MEEYFIRLSCWDSPNYIEATTVRQEILLSIPWNPFRMQIITYNQRRIEQPYILYGVEEGAY